jgi:hypothetical protein
MQTLTATKKGVVIGFVLIITSIITFYLLHLPENGNSQYLTIGLYILGIFWILFSYKKNTSNLGIKSFFTEGFKGFIVVTLLMVVYTFVFYKLNPQILEKGIADNNELIKMEGNKTLAEIRENENKLRSMFMPMMLMLNTIKYLILGALVSLVMGTFLSQKK